VVSEAAFKLRGLSRVPFSVSLIAAEQAFDGFAPIAGHGSPGRPAMG
jgi:hypothetical protein